MRILHIVHQYPPEHLGGTELYTQSLAQALVSREHHVAIFTRCSRDGRGHSSEMEEGVQIVRVWHGANTPSRRFAATYGDHILVQMFVDLLERFQPDLIHIQHLMGLPLRVLDLIEASHIPYVITLHDYWWVCANAQLLTNYSSEVCAGPRAYINCTHCAIKRAGRYAWLLAPGLTGLLAWRAQRLRHGMTRAQALISSHRFVAEWHVRHGAPAQSMRILKLGIDTKASSKHQPRDPAKPARLLYVGGISKQKGLHVILDAFRRLNRHAELWIVGDMEGDSAYATSLRDLASPEVKFLGQIAHPDIWQLLASADVLLVPSLWYETYCLTAHEAFAAGVPVIASKIGVLAEVVSDEVDGLLVTPGDVVAWRLAMRRVIDDVSLTERMRHAIRKPVSVDQHVDHLLEIYTSALNA